jgi:hypothetical protein
LSADARLPAPGNPPAGLSKSTQKNSLAARLIACPTTVLAIGLQ